MSKNMKKFTFKGVLDGIRASAKDRPEDGPGGGKMGPGGVGREPGTTADLVETLRPEHFKIIKVRIHHDSYDKGHGYDNVL